MRVSLATHSCQSGLQLHRDCSSAPVLILNGTDELSVASYLEVGPFGCGLVVGIILGILCVVYFMLSRVLFRWITRPRFNSLRIVLSCFAKDPPNCTALRILGICFYLPIVLQH